MMQAIPNPPKEINREIATMEEYVSPSAARKQAFKSLSKTGECVLHFSKPWGSLKRGGDYTDAFLGGSAEQTKEECAKRRNGGWSEAVTGFYWTPKSLGPKSALRDIIR